MYGKWNVFSFVMATGVIRFNKISSSTSSGAYSLTLSEDYSKVIAAGIWQYSTISYSGYVVLQSSDGSILHRYGYPANNEYYYHMSYANPSDYVLFMCGDINANGLVISKFIFPSWGTLPTTSYYMTTTIMKQCQ